MFERLIDHHCHGVSPAELDRTGLEALMSESHQPASPFFGSQFDKPLGLAMRRHCAPVLGLAAMADPAQYAARRQALGAEEVNRRLLRAAGVSDMLIDTGHRGDVILGCTDMAALSGVPCSEVVRIEAVFESVADADDPLTAFAEALHGRAADAVGLKSIIAYRAGFRIDQARPSQSDASAALDRWRIKRAGAGPQRLDDPVLLMHALWTGLDLAAARKLPIQLHVGFGDRDIAMPDCDPTHFTPFIAAAEDRAVPVTLLHCYPFEREAAWLAEVYSNVFYDVGAVLNYTGPSAVRVLRDAMEMGNFSKQLYSSDAFGLAELHHLGRVQFEAALNKVLSGWISDGACTLRDADRIAEMIAWQNVARIYTL